MDWFLGFCLVALGFGLGIWVGCWVCGGIVGDEAAEQPDPSFKIDGRHVYSPPKYPMH